MADRIVVVRDGRIEQVGTPIELYDSPANVFVAEFIGSPAMNLLPARLITREGRMAAIIHGGAVIQLPPQLSGKEGQAIMVGIRPEHFKVGGGGGLTGKVALVET